MGTLNGMIEFLESSIITTEKIIDKLNTIQEHFNSSFSNIIKVRTSEMEFLENEFFSSPEKFPDGFEEIYHRNLSGQKKNFRESLLKLTDEKIKLENEIKFLNGNNLSFFSSLKTANTELDKKVEKIKDEISSLEKEISEFNRNIEEFNTGFGFIINFFNMKRIENKREILLRKREALINAIVLVRNKWTDKDKEIQFMNAEIREKWSDLFTGFSLVSEKIDTITSGMEMFIKKAALSETLSDFHGGERYVNRNIGLTHPERCRRCSSRNKKNYFFCNLCGEPFIVNRRDVEFSLIRTAELNRVYEVFEEGIKRCLSYTELIQSIKEGMSTFLQSLIDVKKSEDNCSVLPTLKIDVPEFSIKFEGSLKEIEKKLSIDFFILHPAEFASKMLAETEMFLNVQNIEMFFTSMGDELQKRTKEQWKDGF